MVIPPFSCRLGAPAPIPRPGLGKCKGGNPNYSTMQTVMDKNCLYYCYLLSLLSELSLAILNMISSLGQKWAMITLLLDLL